MKASRNALLAAAVTVVCIAAMVAGLNWKTNTPLPAKKTPILASEDGILDQVPQSNGDSVSGKQVAVAISVIRKDPALAKGWVALGDALAQQLRETGDNAYYNHAALAYKRALKSDKKNTGAMVGMAWVAGGRHSFANSDEWSSRALAVDPKNAAAYGLKGDSALERGEYDRAFEFYQTMMDLRPDLSSWSRGAHLLWMTGERARASILMARAINSGAPFAENTAWCRAKLGTMQLNNGSLIEAKQTIRTALATSPSNVHVLLVAAKIASYFEDYQSARAHFQKILEAGLHHEALVGLGELCMKEGDQAGAEAYFEQVELLHRTHAKSGVHDHMQMAKFYADHDRKLKEALELAEQHKTSLNVVDAHILAIVYFKNGDLPKAIAAAKNALRLGTPEPEFYFDAGMIAAAAGDRVAAQTHLQKALNYNPRFNVLKAPMATRKLNELGSTVEVSAVENGGAKGL